MDSDEFIELKNRFLLGLLVAVIVAFLLILFFANKFGFRDSKILKAINQNKTFFLLLIDSDECSQCSNYLEKLEDSDVKYYKYDVSIKADYDEFLEKVELTDEMIECPGIIYIEKGEMVANIMGIDDESIFSDFVERYS